MITTDRFGYNKTTRNFYAEISDFNDNRSLLDQNDENGYRGLWVKSAKTGVTKFYRYVGVETDREGDIQTFKFRNGETNTTLTLFND